MSRFDLDTELDAIRAEVESALESWPAFNSAHEGFSVMYEEVDELWEHVKMKPKNRDTAMMKAEAVQVAAMALRFILEVCNDQDGRR